MAHIVEVPVLVVGAGPVGVTLANLLGSYGVETLVLERNQDVLDYPRAVGLDDEAMRTFQSAGLADEMLRDMIQNVPMRMYTRTKRCFAEILPATREFGWYRRNLFSQPLGERTLRAGLRRFPHVTLELGTELLSLTQDERGVTVRVRDAEGAEREIRTQYLLAADGGRSAVRERILQLPFDGNTHPRKWVVIECDQDPLDAPYTALHCEPRRPYVCLRLPYGLRRWEFMLFPGEDGEQMLQPEKVQELLRHHVADPTRLNVIRARVYTHNSRVARSFVSGRVCLAGDAAHLTPPWIGQGLNAGLRDAFNLAWKVAWIVQGRLDPAALQSYHDERHSHARAMISLADMFGAMLSQTNPVLAALRDTFFLSIRNIPKIRDYVLQMKFKPMPRYSRGVVGDSADRTQRECIGRMFIQPLVEGENGATLRLDEALGAGFALIGWRRDPRAGLPPALRAQLDKLGCRYVAAQRARSGCDPDELQAGALPVLQDTENALHFWFQRTRADWVLVRPDRYVAALGRREDAADALGRYAARFVPGAAQATSQPAAQASSPAHAPGAMLNGAQP